MNHAIEALHRYQTLGHPVWEARAHNAVGWTAAQLGDHDTARHHCLAALGLHQRGKDLSGRAETLDSLGYIEHHTGNHRGAVQHYQTAVELRRAIGDSYQVANALDGLGHPYVALGHYEQAGAVWREAWERYRHQGYDKDADRIRSQLDDLDRRTAGG